jgi:hypothetical protein
MTWTLVRGNKGSVKGLRVSGPQGPTHYLLILVLILVVINVRVRGKFTHE